MYAERIAGLKSSAIRDILKLTSREGMISFAGGLPAPELFPLKELSEATQRVLSKHGSNALQYAITEGHIPLREKIAHTLAPGSTRLTLNHLIITQGSQQGLELLAKLYLDKGSVVYTENPSYLGALQAFRLFQAEIAPIPTDDQGILPDALRGALKKRRPAFLYLMPNFQNPTGVSLSLERRREIVEISKQSDLLVVEDDPYGDLFFEGEKLPSLFALGDGRNIIYLSTFSKTIAPGLRVAFAAADEEIAGKLAMIKQGTDLQTNTLGQFIVNEYLESGLLPEHLRKLRTTYRVRRDLMLTAMKEHFPSTLTWNRPGGGMFLWVTLPENWNAKDILLRCIEHNVAFVPGQEFYPDGSGRNTMRMNFSNASPENIEAGIKRMGMVLKKLS
ncbi:MAG: PLP-dependent aminotransferase family protein [Nitrospirota bacterium]